MNDISTYTDYRLLLSDYYACAKLHNPRFSYQVFSQRAGISSRGFLYNVVNGKRRLALSHVAGVARAMKLSKNEQEYFEHLVAYTNAKSIPEKQRYFERMHSVKMKSEGASQLQIVRREQYRYYSEWYHAVVRSLIDLTGFNGDYERLAQQVSPPITPSQAKKSVALLERLGFIIKDTGGIYRLTEKTITSAPEVVSLAIHNFHQQTLDIARKALDTLPRDRRNFTGVTLGISSSAYGQVCREIEQFRNRLLELAANDDNTEEKQGVYHLNLQFFPVSQTIPPQE